MAENKDIMQVESLFEFKDKPVRHVMIDSEPWWIAGDVCKALSITNPSNAVSRLEDYEKGIHTVYTPGGNQKVICVNESGLYSLIFTSRKEEAKIFKKWVTTEVLPSIRKNGTYTLGERELQILIDDKMQTVFDRLNELEQKIEANSPKTLIRQTLGKAKISDLK